MHVDVRLSPNAVLAPRVRQRTDGYLSPVSFIMRAGQFPDSGQIAPYRARTSQNLGVLRQAITGSEVFSGSATQHLGVLRQALTGSEVFSGSATQRLGVLRQALTGAEVFSGSATQKLGTLRQALAGAEVFLGTAAQRLGTLRQAVAGTYTAPAGGTHGTITQHLGGLRAGARGQLNTRVRGMSYWHGRTIKPGDKVINRKTGSYGIASVNSKGAYVAVTGGAPGNLKDWTKK